MDSIIDYVLNSLIIPIVVKMGEDWVFKAPPVNLFVSKNAVALKL
jgi:hypothetical protein